MLDHQLCFAIYAANNSVIRAYQRELKKVGLTYPQYLILLVLWEVKNISVKYLANRLKLDPEFIYIFEKNASLRISFKN